MSWQPPPSGAKPSAQEKANDQNMDYYELLQVNRDAHPTIIRYAYRFLAAMYHPDNGETGNADKFRTISEAWRTLSDEGKRAAYDLSLGMLDQRKAEQNKNQPGSAAPQFKRDALPSMPKTNLTWDEIELRIAVLQVLLEARRRKPASGGGSGKYLMDCLNIENVGVVEFALWYLREKGLIEMGDRHFVITAVGVDYLTDQLSKTQILGGGNITEEKTKALIEANKTPMN
jgi:hypothetical protein